jgi:alkylhydroperoxidase family enzyme
LRINIAFHNQCKYCMATRYGSGRRAGIDEPLVDQIPDYENGGFTERERAALAYSDQLVFDLPEVSSGVVDRLRRSFTDAEILELTWAICLWIETGRLFAALDVPYAGPATVARS